MPAWTAILRWPTVLAMLQQCLVGSSTTSDLSFLQAHVGCSRMSKEKLKRIATVAGVTSLAAAVLLYGIYSIWKLPFLGWSGFASFLLLIRLTGFPSRFTLAGGHIW